MFRSRKRSLITPQREHARLAGMFAEMWGNENFELPQIPFHSLLSGIALHDCGYEPFDTAPIPDVDEERWLNAQRKGAALDLEDATADLLIKLHVKRLVSFKNTPARIACAKEIEEKILARLSDTSYSREQLEWCDRITHFCDNLAFDFCFEEEKTGCVEVPRVWGSSEETKVNYQILANGCVKVSPWPFKSRDFQRFIVGYDAEQYPAEKRPILLTISLSIGTVEKQSRTT